MTGVSISEVDKVSGSPKLGDKIARNPKNHADCWLVAKAYFEDNFAPMDSSDALRTIAAQLAEALDEMAKWDGDRPQSAWRKRHAALAAWKEWNRES